MKLRLEDVTVRYGAGRRAMTAVDGVDLAVPAGGTLGLVGESGCGKSTVAKAIVGQVPIASGGVFLDGTDVSLHRSRGTRAYRRRVQMVFQDPYSSLNPRMTVGDAVIDALGTRGPGRRSARRVEATRLLDLVGLPSSALDRYPHQFSGGQRQRVAIARALAVEPEVIVHDEVTSALDVSVQAAILNLLRELQRELGLSYLFISHDLAAVRYMSDSVTVMYLGRVVETAGVDDLFARPTHPYTEALIASVPKVRDRDVRVPVIGDIPDPRQPPVGCRFHPRCSVGPRVHAEREVCVQVDPQGIAPTRLHGAACHFADSAAV